MSTEKMLIITAPGRCGTSLVAKYCRLLGHDPGGEWDNPSNSGLECRRVQIANNAIDRNDSNDVVTAKIRSSLRPVAKNCRFFRETKIVNAWHKAVPRLRFLALWRDPLDQYASWLNCSANVKTEDFCWSPKDFVDWTTGQRLEFTANCSVRGIPIRWLQYPYLLDQQALLAKYLHWGGLQFDGRRAREIWDNLVDTSLVHHHTALFPEREVALA